MVDISNDMARRVYKCLEDLIGVNNTERVTSTYIGDLCGISRTTACAVMKALAERGCIKYNATKGQGTIVSVIHAPRFRKKENENDDTENIRYSPPKPKCPYCGSVAPSATARFCWKCGKKMLTEKELLHEEWTSCLARIARNIMDSSETNKIIETLTKVEKAYFTEA